MTAPVAPSLSRYRALWIRCGVLSGLNIASQLASAALTGYSVGSFFVSEDSFEEKAKTLAKDVLLSMLPVASFKTIMKLKGLKFVDVQGQTFYRYMSKVEYEAVKIAKRLRGERTGTTYFTKDAYTSAKQAQSKLALDDLDIPEIRVKVLVKNNPRTINRSKVQQTRTQTGGGSEYFSSEGVYVDILEAVELK